MKERIIEKLTKSVLDSIVPEEIIYAEVAGGGAMGNSGGIMLYLIKEDALICYETNVSTNEEIYNKAEELLVKHIGQSRSTDSVVQDKLFDRFYGGMGNNSFVNVNVTFEITDSFFIYKKDNIDYHIRPSVRGVFNSVVYEMKKSKSDEI